MMLHALVKPPAGLGVKAPHCAGVSPEARGILLPMGNPSVYVLVLNWNGQGHLGECFDSLLAGTCPNARFVLIDNASKDESVAFVRERYGADPRVRILVNSANLGWSQGNNVGLEFALAEGADYVLLLNNDTVLSNDALEKLVHMAEARPEIGALAPKLLFYDHPYILNSLGLECSIIGNAWDVGIGRLDGPRWREPRPVIGVCGGAFFIRTRVLHATGLLPSDFGIYLDDLDLSFRIWNAGFAIWNCPDAVVRHKFSATMGQQEHQRRKYYLSTRNQMRVILLNVPWTRLPHVAPAMLVGEGRALGRAALDGEWWRIFAHLRAWAATAAYAPSIFAERRRRKRRGLAMGRFWPLIRTDRLFFQGTELPKDGWYAPRRIAGKTLRPMSSRARLDVRPGRLRLVHANCYPDLGPADVRVSLNGEPLVLLSATAIHETVVNVSGGSLGFEALRIFEAEDTGELVDIGGWIGVTEEP